MLSDAICMIKGHFYRPVHEYRVRAKNLDFGTPKQGQRYRYSCERCGQKTKWMSSREHKAFCEYHCPTWGDPGSDSQNYRKPIKPKSSLQ